MHVTPFPPDRYGDTLAGVYDRWYPMQAETEAAVSCLAAIAGDGAILELGVGTGRLAIPLADRGFEVHGVDSSPAMLAALRRKRGGERVTCHLGTLQELPIGRFSLVFAAFNTIWTAPTRAAQLACLAATRRVLAKGGAFVAETHIPDPARYDRGQRLQTSRVGASEVVLDAAVIDESTNNVNTDYVVITPDGIRLCPGSIRLTTPQELDSLAALNGLRLTDRWANWERHEFARGATAHVSVYRELSARNAVDDRV
jgi:SAM-dependent methyltransferase